MNETLPMVRLLPTAAGPFTKAGAVQRGKGMATVQDIFLQELLRVFNNTGGGGVSYGGTGQTGTITGNPTGGSGTGSSYTTGDILNGEQYGPDGKLQSAWAYAYVSGDRYRVSYNVVDGTDYYDEIIDYTPGDSLANDLSQLWYTSSQATEAATRSFLDFQYNTWQSFNRWLGDQIYGEDSSSPPPQEPTIPSEPIAGVHKVRFIVRDPSFSAQVDISFGTLGNDTVKGAGVLLGDAGNDGLTGSVGADILNGGLGNDWLDGGAGGDLLDGGAGWDVVSYKSATSGVAVDMATNANGGAACGDVLSNIEVLQGSDYDDSLTGMDRGGGNGVELHGEGGHDQLRGAAGGDRLYGGAGNDWLAGLGGDDVVEGGEGNDVVGGQEGNDTLSGGAGDDEVWGGAGDDIAHGDAGNDAIRGEDGNDTLYGDAGNDWIAGQGGNDFVDGGEGNDVVGGQEGNDTLNGGSGSDELWGGSGADWFLFDAPLGAGNADRIMDFSAAEGDMIMLNHNVFPALGLGLLSASAFKVGAATSTSHKILYNSYTGDLSYDVDGWGAAAAVKIAQLNPGTTLSASNFFIV